MIKLNTVRNKEIVAKALHRYHCLSGEAIYYEGEIFLRGPSAGDICEDSKQKLMDTLWMADAEDVKFWYNKADIVLRALDIYR